MADPDDLEAEAVASAVEAGTDGITLPDEFTYDEPAPQAKPPDAALWARITTMKVGQRIKLAMRGNKEARILLTRDSNRLVRLFVLRNPQITETEIVAIVRNRSSDDDALRQIADSREWMKNYQVRLGLATNPKAPVPVAMKLLSTLTRRDLGQIAKSRNVPQVVATQARRMIAEMKD